MPYGYVFGAGSECVFTLFDTCRFVDLLLDDKYTTQTDRCPYREKGVCVLCYYTCLFVVEHMTLFNLV
jgi:hypothetical protein